MPEGLHSVAVALVLNIQMAGEHIGEAPDLAPAHRIGLTCDRKRPHAGATDAPGGKMAIDDRVDLIAARRGLVYALAIDGDDLFCAGPQPQECGQIGCGQVRLCGITGTGGGQGLGVAWTLAR